MFGIGHFAQVAQVSVRTLRHYGDVGLLIPASVDPDTGYRSYSADQLPVLNRILVLKDLGFTLAEIAELTERDAASSSARRATQRRGRTTSPGPHDGPY